MDISDTYWVQIYTDADTYWVQSHPLTYGYMQLDAATHTDMRDSIVDAGRERDVPIHVSTYSIPV